MESSRAWMARSIPTWRRGFRSERGFASCPTTPARPVRSFRSIRRSPRMVSRSNGDVSMAGEIVAFNPATMAAPGGHYSHSISANGFVFVSGQLPIAPDGTKLNEAPFEQQAQQVLDNVAHALKAAGSSIAGLTQVRVYVTDIEAWPAFNTLYAAWAGAARPARAQAALRIQDRGRSRRRQNGALERNRVRLNLESRPRHFSAT